MSVLQAQSVLFISSKDFDAGSISLFGALSEQQLNDVCAYLHIEHHAAGSTLFNQGDSPSNIYVLLDGRVDCVRDHQGVATLSSSLSYGEAFGESAFVGIQCQQFSAKVSIKSTLLVLDRDSLMQLYAKDLELFALLMMNLARELARKYHKLLEAEPS